MKGGNLNSTIFHKFVEHVLELYMYQKVIRLINLRASWTSIGGDRAVPYWLLAKH